MSDLFTNSLQNRILELEDSDTEDNFEQFEPVLSRAEEAFIKAKKTERGGLDYFESPVNKDVYQSIAKLTPAELKQQSIDTVKSIADVTPIIGDIKAATELPNDLSYAFELVESGYDEGDLKKMGLGGAFAMLSAMGIVPGVRIGAKAGKEAIKASIKAPEGLDIKSKKDIFGLTPKVQDDLINDFEMLGNAQNQIVTNKQIKDIIEIKTGFTPNVQTTNEIEAALNDKGISTVNNFDQFKKLTGQDVKEASLTNLKAEKPKLIGGTFAKMDVDMTPDQKFLVDRIRSNLTTTRNLSDTYGQGYLAPNVAEGRHNIKIKGKQYNIKNKADQIEIVKMLPKSIRRTVIEEMNRPMPKIFHGSAGISQPYGRATAYADMTRAEVLEKEGFMPFTDFEEGVEIGLGGSKGATGIHMELGKKMLSTSRDPLVSIKRGFGANIPANVVSAPLPRSQVRPMKPEEYDISKSKAQYSRDDTATSLPMHRHKEAEIALSRPEDIESIRQLSRQEDPIRKTEPVDREDLKNLGKMSLEDRVITGQRFANSITNKFDVLEALIPDDRFGNYISKMQEGNLKPRQALVAYNEVRDIMKDLKTLGQFTEQYGARGTYDSLYKTFRAKNRERVKFIAESLPKGEKKNLLTSLHKVMDDYGAYNTGATGKKVLRKKSDKEILNALKSDDVADALTKLEGYPDNRFSEDDLKRMTFLLTDRMSRGGLMAKA